MANAALHGGPLAHVAHGVGDGRTICGQLRGGIREPLGIDVGEEHRVVLGEARGDRGAESPCRAGDECDTHGSSFAICGASSSAARSAVMMSAGSGLMITRDAVSS